MGTQVSKLKELFEKHSGNLEAKALLQRWIEHHQVVMAANTKCNNCERKYNSQQEGMMNSNTGVMTQFLRL